MSQTLPAAEKNAASLAKQPLVPPDERFWQRYSPHGELPLSGAGSLALHLLIIGLMLLSAWLAYAVFSHTTRSLPVEAVRLDLGGGGGNPHGLGDGPNRGNQPQEVGGDKTQDGAANPDPVDTDRPKLDVQPATSAPIQFDPVATRLIQQTDTTSSRAMQMLAKAGKRPQLADPPQKSGRGKGGTGEGGGSGSGKGTGTGDGRGEGRGKLTQREKRMLRWSMLFDTRSGRDYLAQLQGLGAILAIPDANGKNYKIIRDLSARPAKLLDEDISQIQRIYWIDDKPESVRDVMAILGVQLQPSHFVAFMPEELEKKLFDLEKAYLKKHHGKRGEDDIIETRFKITRDKKGFE
ncbi:MAG TPA: hypothetical protein VH575_21950, partial [Gemmataceae bacterium]